MAVLRISANLLALLCLPILMIGGMSAAAAAAASANPHPADDCDGHSHHSPHAHSQHPASLDTDPTLGEDVVFLTDHADCLGHCCVCEECHHLPNGSFWSVCPCQDRDPLQLAAINFNCLALHDAAPSVPVTRPPPARPDESLSYLRTIVLLT